MKLPPSLFLVLGLAFLAGCASETMPAEQFAALAEADSSGPMVKAGAISEVWSADQRWTDTDTPAARAAGLAWPASSALTWEQKYARWVAGLEQIDRPPSGKTFSITTPEGKTLPAPTLECAEVGMFLRATFASWYHLPFFLKGYDQGLKKSVYAGHFGFVDAGGAVLKSFPTFRTRYKDHTKGYDPSKPWPSDATLRKMRLADDDGVPFLDTDGFEAGAGAYFDAIYLNKRTGYFMRLLLLYFGSMNLADGSNMYHLEPEAIAPGDLLVERWQKQGIGHVLPIMRVTAPMEGKLAADIASGSMPRRQPVWKGPLEARTYFTSEYTGGPGVASDKVPYAELGGGLRRFREPVLKGGRWFNVVPDESLRIPESDVAAIAARPARFDELLVSGTPEERRSTALAQIEAAREHLRAHPASCSARESRETAFADLYAVSSESFGEGAAEVDAKNRSLEDYVFQDLVYTQAKTCCWNSTTPAMAEVILDYAKKEQDEAAAKSVCAAPTVFRASGGGDGFALWRAHAEATGRAADWRSWSEDEPCAQKSIATDALAESSATPWCELEPVSDDPCGGVTWEGQCDGTSLSYCSAGSLITLECGDSACGWDSSAGYYACL